MGPRPPTTEREGACTSDAMRPIAAEQAALSRRRFLESTAAGLSTLAMPDLAWAQAATRSPALPDEFVVPSLVSIEVHARPIPSFDRNDHTRVRFGELEYRSGLILTSPFPGFGGLSGIGLDAKGERFISFSDHGNWFTGRILYQGREMTGLAEVEAAPMLGPDGKPIQTRGWFDSESIAVDGSFVYIGLERANQVLRFDFSKGFTRSRGEIVRLPPAASRLPRNKGLEALVFVPKGMALAGTLIAISNAASTPRAISLPFWSAARRPGSSAFAAPEISMSATRCCWHPASS